MNKKQAKSKYGIVIGLLMFVGALLAPQSISVVPIVGVMGIFVFFISLILTIIHAIRNKKYATLKIDSALDNKITIEPEPSSASVPLPAPDNIAEPEQVSVSAPVTTVESEHASEIKLNIEPVPEEKEAVQKFIKLAIEDFINESSKSGYVAFDFETTGLSSDNERIIEIGAIKVDFDGNEIDRYSTLVNPEKHLPSNIAAMTGLSDGVLRSAPTIDQVLSTFLEFIGDYPVIAWNVSFDKGFLEKAACRCNLGCDIRYADALAWARTTYHLEKYKQNVVAEHIGYVPTDKHRAIADCETLVAIIKDMSLHTNEPVVRQTASSVAIDLARSDEALNANAYELAIAEHFIAVIKAQKPDMNPILMRRSQSYLSLCQGRNDFLRIKYTDRARWISIDSWGAELEEDNELFAAQANKRQRHWKAKLNNIDDIGLFDNYVIKACKTI